MRTGTRSTIWLACVATLAILAAAGCGFGVTSIGDIQARAGQYIGKDVTIAGEASDAFKLPMLPGWYTLKDSTGQITVVTDGQPPTAGTRVRVSGRVETAATINGKAIGLHLVEASRK